MHGEVSGVRKVFGVRASGSKRREKEENSNLNWKLSWEKLRSLVEFFDELDLVVDNLKNDVQSAIRDNKIRVDDFYGYVEVTDKIKISAKNARERGRGGKKNINKSLRNVKIH